MAPTTRYARSGEASIAYQVVGEEGPDILFLPGWISHIEQLWEAPAARRYVERLASFGRLIIFDRRGTGLSDRAGGVQTLEQDSQDALAVLDAAGSERAALFTYALGGLVGALLAADHPERVGALIMYASVARTAWAADYDWALPSQEREVVIETTVSGWGEASSPVLKRLAPSVAEDPVLIAWFSRLQRLAASPVEARLISKGAVDIDVRAALPRIGVPTLVMHREGDLAWDVRHSRYLAQHIEGARYVELAGGDSLPFFGDSDAIVEEIESFLTGGRC